MTGQTISHFRVLEKIGGGGMGVVYLGEDEELGRKVALKFLPPHLSTDEGANQRFVQEAKAASALNHPNVCTIYEIGHTDEGQTFILMALYEGETLKEKLASGPLPAEEAANIARQVAEGLAAAHERNIIHRDIKPANIYLTKRGRAVILDFGLAKLVGAVDLTKSGSALGTIGYMSPEQVRGEPLDHRTDLWSLGVLLFELLTATRPFRGDYDQAIAYSILNEDPPPIADLRNDVPAETSRVVEALLRKDASDRYQSGREVIAELTPGPDRGSADSRRRHYVRPLWTAVGLLTVASIALYYVLKRPDDSGETEVVRTWQITHAIGLEADPAVSPDGSMLAYSSGPEGQMRIRVRQVQAGRTITLTDDVPGNQRWPRWSPDAERILFQTDREVFVIPALGGFARRIAEAPEGEEIFGADWSPDGTRVAISQGNAVHIKDLENGTVLETFSVFEPHSVSWSPDGRYLTLVSGNPFYVFGTAMLGNLAPSSIWVASVSTGELSQVTSEDAQSASPVWFPDGRSLLWISNAGGSRDIYRSLVDSGRPRGEPERLTTGLNAHSMTMTSDGRRIAYSVLDGTANVWAVDVPDVGRASVRSAVSITAGTQQVESVNVSADGRWLALDSDLAGNQDIYIRPLPDGELNQLTTNTADDFAPSWSPDGQSIAFHSFRDGNRELYVASRLDGSVERVTNHPAQDRAPDFSPDGNRLVFFSDRTGRQELFVVSRIQGGWSEPVQITQDGGLHAEWSPSSDQIAYLSGSHTHTMSSTIHELRLISADGGDPVVLLDAVERGLPVPEAPEWSTDGRYVYYKAYDEEGTASIWRIPASGGEPELVILFDDERRRSLYRHELAVDERRIYFTLGDIESDIWMMELAFDR